MLRSSGRPETEASVAVDCLKMARYEVLPRQELITHPKCTAHVTQPPWRHRTFELEPPRLHPALDEESVRRRGDRHSQFGEMADRNVTVDLALTVRQSMEWSAVGIARFLSTRWSWMRIQRLSMGTVLGTWAITQAMKRAPGVTYYFHETIQFPIAIPQSRCTTECATRVTTTHESSDSIVRRSWPKI